MKKDRYVFGLTALCTMAYFLSYLVRINYQAMIEGIIASENLTESIASFALTGLFIFYGLGQLVSGVLGDRIDPRLLVFFGLGASSLINLCMPLFPNVVTMTVLWTLNGFAQAMIWPPLVKIMRANFSEENYEKAAYWVSCGSASATVAIYFLVPFFLSVSSWKAVFIACAAIGLAGCAVWIISTMKMKLDVPQKKASALPDESMQAPESSPSAKWSVILPLLLSSLALQGLLRDGISTWTPTYLNKTFDLGAALSILSSVALPIFNIFSFSIAGSLMRKCKNNEPFTAGVMFVTLSVVSVCLYFFGGLHWIVAVLFLTLCSGLTHGINYILICIAPRRFQGSTVSSLAGLFNFSVYVGSALSTFGFAELSTRFGWGLTIASWALVAGTGAILCFASVKHWRKGLMQKRD